MHVAFGLGLLLLTLAMLRIPAMRVPGLILTPLLWTAFCIALLMRKKRYSLVSYGWTSLAVMLAGLGLLLLSSATSEAQEYCVWLVTAVGVLLFLPPLLAAEKRVPKICTQDAFAVRALGLSAMAGLLRQMLCLTKVRERNSQDASRENGGVAAAET